MNFNDVVNEVVGIVKRPNLLNAVKREVNSACTFYSLDNDFPRDFNEQRIDLNPLEYTQSFLISDMTRFRKFKYLKRSPTRYLDLLTEAALFSRSFVAPDLRDKYYIAGDVVNLSFAALSASIDIGYYMYPPLLTGAVDLNNYWILDVSPYMVIERAAGTLFKDIGDEKSMQTHLGNAKDLYMAFLKDQRSAF